MLAFGPIPRPFYAIAAKWSVNTLGHVWGLAAAVLGACHFGG